MAQEPDAFFTASSSRTNPESSGLGLYLSKQLVVAMAGTLTAKLPLAGGFGIQLTLSRPI
ncbi:ATP-binding protein [Lactobacillus sp. CBA3606]|uniref:ATP-binding protein n=1 Tax=Lactobacillus sp. CBA3606 TaxID=2099789 RepID=UPI001319E485|nr:ATP-binding protein [Lactobacillus sp. CBA3606]